MVVKQAIIRYLKLAIPVFEGSKSVRDLQPRKLLAVVLRGLYAFPCLCSKLRVEQKVIVRPSALV